MADRMAFPKTIQEFMDGYSFKDDKEIYTNGSRLIPVFRVEQALEHYGQEIRNKAIDDFAEELKSTLPIAVHMNCSEIDYAVEYELYNMRLKIDRIAQQLKDGGTDG